MENLKRSIFEKSESVILNFALKWNRAPAKLHAQMAVPANCQALTEVTPTCRNIQNTEQGGFPSGSVLRNPPTDAGYKGWIPDTGKSPHVEQQLSPRTAEPARCSKTPTERSPHTTTRAQPLLPATRKALLAAKTRCNQKQINKSQEKRKYRETNTFKEFWA